jgi:hypothetical protein
MIQFNILIISIEVTNRGSNFGVINIPGFRTLTVLMLFIGVTSAEDFACSRRLDRVPDGGGLASTFP